MGDVYSSPVMHYGVKGMKWGVRRTPEQLAQNRARKDARKQEVRRRKEVRRDRRVLSNEELQREVDRLNLERRYRDLSSADLNPGRSAVNRFLQSTGGRVATSAAVGTLAYLGYSMISGTFNPDKAADYIFPNPNRKK